MLVSGFYKNTAPVLGPSSSTVPLGLVCTSFIGDHTTDGVTLPPSSSFLIGLQTQTPHLNSVEDCVVASILSLDSFALTSMTWETVRVATVSDNDVQKLIGTDRPVQTKIANIGVLFISQCLFRFSHDYI